MTSIFEVLYCRRPVLNYVCPPVCEVLFSGSGFPVIVLGDFSSLVSPGGVRFGGFGNFHLSWNRYPGAICYNVYRAETDDPNSPLVLIFECVPGTDVPLPPGCYSVSAITPDGETALSMPPVCYFVPPMLPPEVTTMAASDVLAASATLNGIINAVGQASTAQFEWGTTLAYGNFTPLQPTGDSFDNVPFNANITGLVASSQYHYRAIGSNGSGIANGEDMTFITGVGPSAFWDLTWATYQENMGPGSTFSTSLLPAFFSMTMNTAAGSDGILEYNGAMLYTGVAKTAHLHLVVTTATTVDMFGVIRFFVDGSEVFFAYTPETIVSGTYDFDFPIPESINALIEVYFAVSNGNPLPTDLQWAATLTATDA